MGSSAKKDLPDEWSYISWNIKDICGLRRLCSGDIYVKGYRFYLLLEKKFHVNAKNDCLEMQLVDTELELNDPFRFGVAVYIKDALGGNHFLQKSCIVCREFPPMKLIWKITLFDLFENTSLSNKTSLDFVCMFGPESKYQWSVQENTCGSSNVCSCKKHLEKLSLDFSRLLVHDIYADVILKCGGKTFPTHKNILSARSPTFKEVFKNVTSDDESPTQINITDTDISSLGHLLIFLYNGKVLFDNLTVDDAVQLYETALKYQVPGLVEECMEFLVKNLKEDSACRFLLYASEKMDVAFKDRVTSYILKNEILKSDSWIKFSDEHPELAIETYNSYLDEYLVMRSHFASFYKHL